MKDNSRCKPRRVGNHLARRVRRGYSEHLDERWARDDGAVVPTRKRENLLSKARIRNWRIKRYSANEVVAIEPGDEFEIPFHGENAFQEAMDYAREQMRKELADADGNPS